MTLLIVCVVVMLPFIWSAAITALRAAELRHAGAPDDATEKRQLILLLAPMIVGTLMIVIYRLMPVHLPAVALPLPPLDNAVPAGTDPSSTTGHPASFGRWLVAAMMIVYALGVAVRGVPLILAFARLSRIAALSRTCRIAGETVRVTDAAIPALAWGRTTVILPESLLGAFGPAELHLIIRHERAHLHRGDPLYFAFLGWLDALLWFNPFLRWQTQQCRVAAELACDAAVTHAAPADRETYARVLIETLKHTAGDVRQYAPAVFSASGPGAKPGKQSGDYRMRLREIMRDDGAERKTGRKWLYGLAAALALPVLLTQLAWSQTTYNRAGADTPLYVSADGVVQSIDAPGDVPSGNLLIRIDNGGGVVTDYSVRGGSDLKVGQAVHVGDLVSQSGSPETTLVPTTLVPTTLVPTAVGPGTLVADTIHGYAGSDRQIALGHAELHLKGRTVYADAIFSAPETQYWTAQGHIRIQAD